MSDTYGVDCHCFNCGWSGYVRVPKGVPVPGARSQSGMGFSPLSTCENCGCQTLKIRLDIRPGDFPIDGERIRLEGKESRDQIRDGLYDHKRRRKGIWRRK